MCARGLALSSSLRWAAELSAALLAGEVDVANASLAALQSRHAGGKLRLLGSTGFERAAALPDFAHPSANRGSTLASRSTSGFRSEGYAVQRPRAPRAEPRASPGRPELRQRAQDELQAQVRFPAAGVPTPTQLFVDAAIRAVAENLGLRA